MSRAVFEYWTSVALLKSLSCSFWPSNLLTHTSSFKTATCFSVSLFLGNSHDNRDWTCDKKGEFCFQLGASKQDYHPFGLWEFSKKQREIYVCLCICFIALRKSRTIFVFPWVVPSTWEKQDNHKDSAPEVLIRIPIDAEWLKLCPMCQGRKRNPWNERAGNLCVPAAFEAGRTPHRVRERQVLLGSQAGGELKQEHLGGRCDALVPCPEDLYQDTELGADPCKGFEMPGPEIAPVNPYYHQAESKIKEISFFVAVC